MTVEIEKKNVKNTCNNVVCFVFFVSDNNKIHTYEGSVSGEKIHEEVSFDSVRIY